MTPFLWSREKYGVDNGALVIGPDTIRAYSPTAVKHAAEILVANFRLPISLIVTLTETIAPVASKNFYVVIISELSNDADWDRELTISVYSAKRFHDHFVSELEAVGFEDPIELGFPNHSGWKMVWIREEEPRRNPGRSLVDSWWARR